MLQTLALLASAQALSPPRGVVSVELSGLWDVQSVRSGCRYELQNWLKERLGVEPPDVHTEMDRLLEQGAEFGMMLPGVNAIQREALKISLAASGALEDEEERSEVEVEALAVWLQALDAAAEHALDGDAIAALENLKGLGVECCGITDTPSDSARMPTLAPLLDFTQNTYDFTVPAEDAWGVALQVTSAKFGGAPLLHVGSSASSVHAAAAANFKAIALGDVDAVSAARVARLSDLPDAVERLLP